MVLRLFHESCSTKEDTTGAEIRAYRGCIGSGTQDLRIMARQTEKEMDNEMEFGTSTGACLYALNWKCRQSYGF